MTQWQWVFISDKAVLHAIAPRRAKSVAEEVLAGHKPAVWISDRYAGQQELGERHQVCLAHVLRDVQYAIDCGDTIFAPKIRDHLRWAIRVSKRRSQLKDSTLAVYAAKADTKLDRLMMPPVAHPAGKRLLKQIKAWRTKFFVFMADRDVPPTNNISEQEIRPKAERGLVACLLGAVPPVAAAITMAKQLNVPLRRKTSKSLTQILDAAIATPLKDFAAGLRRDISAIQVALDLPWTTSPVEGRSTD